MSWPEWGQPRISQTRTGDNSDKRCAVPLYRHPGQPRVWWECQRRSLCPLGLQGVRTWARSAARMEAREHVREGKTVIYRTASSEELEVIWPLSLQTSIFSHFRQILEQTWVFNQDIVSAANDIFCFLHLVFITWVFKIVQLINTRYLFQTYLPLLMSLLIYLN